MMMPNIAWATLWLSMSTGAAGNGSPYLDYEHLPNATLFPGPWEDYIKAPANKSHIVPARIYGVRGNVSTSTIEAQVGDHNEGNAIMIGAGGTLSLEFAENIAGR